MKKIQNIYDDPTFFTGYQSLRMNNQGFNELIEKPAIISLLPDLKNKTILDIGCGFGDFERYAIENSALSIIGIDPSYKMLQVAKNNLPHANISFQQVSIEDFESAPNTFDLIVSCVAFHYVEDFDAIIKKITSWLKPGGILIFSIEHSICTAYPEGELKKDEKGRYFHPVYNYRDEGAFQQTWFVENVVKYHRKVSTYINTLIEQGLTIDSVLEPMPTDELIKQRESFAAHKIRPPLLIVKASKNR